MIAGVLLDCGYARGGMCTCGGGCVYTYGCSLDIKSKGTTVKGKVNT